MVRHKKIYINTEYNNYTGYVVIINNKLKNNPYYFVSDWKVSLPIPKADAEKPYSFFILDTDEYFGESTIPIIFHEDFLTVEDAQSQIEIYREKFDKDDISWSLNPELNDESDLIYLIMGKDAKFYDKGMIS